VILNRRGLAAVSRSYALIATGLLLVAGIAFRSVGPRASRAQASPSSVSAPSSAQSVLSNLPVSFEANQGQAASDVKFLARGNGYGLFLTPESAVLDIRSHGQVRMQLANANPVPEVTGNNPLPGKTNYLVGKDPRNWHQNVPTFARVRYSDVYPGIDLVYYGKQGRLEYDFEVAPNANPSQVGLQFHGAENLALSPGGDLLLSNDGSGLRFRAPRLYQTIGNEQRPVQGRFVIRDNKEVGFAVGAYDRTRALVIDPVLVYSSYLGGAGAESSARIAVDSSSNIYVAVATTSTDATLNGSSVVSAAKGGGDILIRKIDSGGTTIVFQTYLGGTGLDTPAGIVVDSGFDVIVAGTTNSTDFPTLNGYQDSITSGSHTFVTSLNPAGQTVLYSTFIAGNGTDTAQGLALDSKNKAYVIGTSSSTDLLTTANAFQPASLATNKFFVAKVDPATTGTDSVPYLTYFGGGNPSNGVVEGGGIAVDANGNVYITGGTNFTNTATNATTDFPILNAFKNCLNAPAATTSCAIGSTQKDAFVAKLNPANAVGDQLQYSTYVGGAGEDVANGIALDSSTIAYITGTTASTEVIAQSGIPFQASPGGGNDAFLAKLSSFTPSTTSTTTTTVTQLYFTYIGGSGDDRGLAVGVDTAQGARVTGSTTSGNLPLQHSINTYAGGTDAFVARIDTTATTALALGHYLTYLGGTGNDEGTSIAVDPRGSAYVAGDTTSANFPVVGSTAALTGASDAFVTKVGPTVNLAVTASAATPNPASIGNQVTFTYTIKNNGDLVTGISFAEQLSGNSGTFVSATATPGSCGTPTGTPSVLTCAVGALNGGATATVTAIFTPTSAGPFGNSAEITVAGSTFHTSSTASTTVSDFAMSINPATRTTPAGTPVTYSITVTPTGSFPSNVSLACGAGLPTGGTCEFINNPITGLTTGAQSRVLTINTVARVTTTAQLHPPSGPLYASWLPVSGLAFLGLGGAAFSRRKKILLSLLLGFMLAGIAMQFGCGDSTATTSTTTGTPAGTYTVTVNATSGTATRSGTVELVVQ
jgi:Beta-propeller repeat/Domain of unknown function DUF11